MKNVLILSASPRRNGNSHLLCDAFFRGAEDAGNQVEKIFVFVAALGIGKEINQQIRKTIIKESSKQVAEG